MKYYTTKESLLSCTTVILFKVCLQIFVDFPLKIVRLLGSIFGYSCTYRSRFLTFVRNTIYYYVFI